MEPFCDNIESLVRFYGEDGRAELNALCSQHSLEFAPQDDTSFPHGGLQIKDGVLRLVYSKGNFGCNVSEVSQDFQETIKSAAASGGNAFNLIARNSVRSDYDPQIDTAQEAIGKLVGVPDIKLNANLRTTPLL